MTSRTRNKRRLDYRVYDSTGVKIDKSIESQIQSTVEMSVPDDQRLNQLLSQQDSLTDDITDFIDENQIEDISRNIGDLDVAVDKIQELRSIYRSYHKSIKSIIPDEYDAKYGKDFESTITNVKNYIKFAKETRLKIRNGESSTNSDGDTVKRLIYC